MRPLRPTPPPLRINVRIPIAVGTGLWAVAFVVLLLLRDELPPDQRWWVWTSAASTVGGLLGLWLAPWIEGHRGDDYDDG